MIEHPLLGDESLYYKDDENKRWKMAFFASMVFLILVITTGLYAKKISEKKTLQENQISTTHLKSIEQSKEIPADFPYLAYPLELKQNYYLEDNSTGRKQLVRKWSTEASPEQAEKIISNYLNRNGWNELLRVAEHDLRTLAAAKDGETLSATITNTGISGNVDIETVLYLNTSDIMSVCNDETALSRTEEPRFIPDIFRNLPKQNVTGSEKLSQTGEWCESFYTYEVSGSIEETAIAYASWLNYLNNGWSNTEKIESGQYILLTGSNKKNTLSIRVSPNEESMNTKVEIQVTHGQ